ncbi:hypothetical protein Q7P37_002245 [Cladosporium fusiforme]
MVHAISPYPMWHKQRRDDAATGPLTYRLLALPPSQQERPHFPLEWLLALGLSPTTPTHLPGCLSPVSHTPTSPSVDNFTSIHPCPRHLPIHLRLTSIAAAAQELHCCIACHPETSYDPLLFGAPEARNGSESEHRRHTLTPCPHLHQIAHREIHEKKVPPPFLSQHVSKERQLSVRRTFRLCCHCRHPFRKRLLSFLAFQPVLRSTLTRLASSMLAGGTTCLLAGLLALTSVPASSYHTVLTLCPTTATYHT